MAWWDSNDPEFKRFLGILFGPAWALSSGKGLTTGEVERKQWEATQALLNGEAKFKENPHLTETRKILAEQEASGLGTPTPAASPSPSPSPTSPSSTTAPKRPADPAAEVRGLLDDYKAQLGTTAATKDPYSLTAQSPVWEGRSKGGRVIRDPDSPNRQREVTKPSDLTRSIAEVQMDPYRWDAGQAKRMAELMENAGFDTKGGSVDQMASIWSGLTQTAARFWMVGKRVSPLDILKRTADGTQAAAPKTTTSTQTTVSVTNALTAEQLAQAALSQRLGRKATDVEVEEFKRELLAAENKNPTTTTTTTTTDGKGNSSSSSKVKQGLNASDFAVDWSLGHNKEEAAAYQTAGIMVPWLFEALKAPV
ncbi:hypothetical protein AB0C33_01915 [Nonomuraea sp. NPDC048881]|uniref:hypothetical protein n=1 Tax=Nonomuraea sp. NPDC048881 TaxID=3155030 RepID=UPI0033F8E60D